jgi:NADH-quinone oxidoreductase subunit M
MEFINAHVLSFLIFFPLISAVVVAALRNLNLAKLIAFGSSIVTLLAAIHVWYYFDGSSANIQFAERIEWIPQLGIQYLVGVDGISLLLVVLTAFLQPLVFLSQWHRQSENESKFLALLLALQSGMFGSLLALDMFLFYAFWEAMLIPMYFIIGLWGGNRRIYATTKFVLYTVAGSLLMLIGAIVLYVLHYQQFGTYSAVLTDLLKVKMNLDSQMWLFGAFAIAFAIKVPLWPFHTWLPDAHVEAPTSGSVILAGVLLKLGTYGLLRFAIPLFPEAVVAYAPLLSGLAVVGIIYGALTAWMQPDAKKLVAYSSVSHLGFVVVGSFAVMSSGVLSVEALTGAVYQMINHGVSTGALFLLVGVIYERRHTRLLEDFGGLASVMPWFAVMLIVATMGSVGLPSTGGFVGEFLILLGTFQASPIAAGLAALGVLFGAIYMLTMCKAILFGKLDKPENQELTDLTAREFAYLVPLAVLVVAMGVFPGAFLDKTRPSIEKLANEYRHYRLIVDMPVDNLPQVANSK